MLLKRLAIPLASLCLLAGTVSAQSLTSLQVSFARSVNGGTQTEVMRGTAYYEAPRKIWVQLVEPVNQMMAITERGMLVYYPDARRAFRILSDVPSSLPFIQLFIGATKPDMGLSETGFTLSESQTRGDTLFTHWRPPDKVKRAVGNATLAIVRDRFVSITMRDAAGTTVMKATCSDHLRHGATYFPMMLVIESHEQDGVTVEEVRYSEPVFDEPLPPSITGFALPDDVEVKEVRW